MSEKSEQIEKVIGLCMADSKKEREDAKGKRDVGGAKWINYTCKEQLTTFTG